MYNTDTLPPGFVLPYDFSAIPIIDYIMLVSVRTVAFSNIGIHPSPRYEKIFATPSDREIDPYFSVAFIVLSKILLRDPLLSGTTGVS